MNGLLMHRFPLCLTPSLRAALLMSLGIHVCLLAEWQEQSSFGSSESGIVSNRLHVLVVKAQRSDRDQNAPQGNSITSFRKRSTPLPVISDSVARLETDSVGKPVHDSIFRQPERSPTGIPESQSPVLRNSMQASRSDGKSSATPTSYVDESGSDLPVVAEGVREWRIALAIGARRFHYYPPVARESGLSGRAEIEITAAPGALPSIRLGKTSGAELLDSAALDMVRRAVRANDMPEVLLGHRISIFLPVDFVLVQ